MRHTPGVLRGPARKNRFALVGALVMGCAATPGCRSNEATPSTGKATADGAYEYIVVGSGAGGAPLAARLARAGKRVLLVEAGDDVGGELRYQVPAMHALATEDPRMAWWFFVQHASDPAIDATDSKHTPDGVLYPRGSALGGSTAVNAMVTVLPSRSDWNTIAALTGDASWRADSMDRYYDRVREWLGVELPDPQLALSDRKVSGFLSAAALAHGADNASAAASLSTALGHDVNEALRSGETTGLYRLPLATKDGKRNGARERVLTTRDEGFPLTIMTGAFVTRLLWSDDGDRGHGATARGVEIVRSHAAYSASLEHDEANATSSAREVVTASAEVIVAGGTFNTPQLLMLSGVGDPTELDAHGITTRVPLAGVGQNLQDRYEAPVVSELASPLDVVSSCALGTDDDADPCLDEWRHGKGVYETPGFLAAVLMRSRETEPLADLAVMQDPAARFRLIMQGGRIHKDTLASR